MGYLTPLGQTPDEPAHLGYIDYLLRNHHLPTLPDLETAHHPPAYYLLLAPLFLLTNNGYFLRLTSIFLSAINLLVIYKYVLLIAPTKNPVGRGTMIFVSLVPMYNFMSMAINNDALSNLLASLIIYYSLNSVDRGLKRSELGLYGLVLLAAAFTKIVLFPFIAISLIVLFWKQKKQRRFVVIFALFLFLLLSVFWFSRNNRLYGQNDFFAWKMLNKINPDLEGNQLIQENPRQWVVLLFHSFWGVFGWFAVYLPVTVYSVLRRTTIILLPFFIHQTTLLWRKSSPVIKKRLLLLGVFAGTTIAAVVRDNLTFFHPQGRYLFPIIGIIGLYYGLSIFDLVQLVVPKNKKMVHSFLYYLAILTPLLYLNFLTFILEFSQC